MNDACLWVDALCIEQNDKMGKRNQIGAVDEIHASAHFRISNAHGSISWAGPLDWEEYCGRVHIM